LTFQASDFHPYSIVPQTIAYSMSWWYYYWHLSEEVPAPQDMALWMLRAVTSWWLLHMYVHASPSYYMLSHQIKYRRKPSTPISLQMCRNFDIVAAVRLIDNPMWIHLCMYTTSLICPQKLKCSPLKSHQTGYHDHDMNWCYVLVVR
jgi:hypothetical protein